MFRRNDFGRVNIQFTFIRSFIQTSAFIHSLKNTQKEWAIFQRSTKLKNEGANPKRLSNLLNNFI